ncbi:MAG: NosD domain-containing protein [Candidatus Methanoperedens sp.]
MKIQDAIDNASEGDTILVDSGTYYENVNVTRQITLRGIDRDGVKPIIDANKNGNGIILSADLIIVEGFSISNLSGFDGIVVTSKGNIISTNHINGISHIGIFLTYDVDHKIINGNNMIINNSASNQDMGIFIGSSNNSILNNNLTGNDLGIWFNDYTDNNTLINNTATNNSAWGIYINGLGNNILIGNKVYNGNGGINVGGNDNILENNSIVNNEGGILMVRANNNTIKRNDCDKNIYYGLDLYLSFYNTIIENNFFNNQENGIIIDLSDNNIIYNNFFNNTNNSYIKASTNRWNTTKTLGENIINGPFLGGNFWKNPFGSGFSQTCADADNDGICDSPYVLESSNIDYLPLKSTDTDIVSQYAGSDGIVQRVEAVKAVRDYFNKLITKEDAVKVVRAYLRS